MKFICQGSSFAQAVQTVSRAISGKSDMPILECIKIEAEMDGVKLTATDGYLSIQKKICADILADGECVVSNKIFCDIVQKLPSTEIEFSLEKDVLYANYNGNVCNFGCKRVEDYPKIDEVKEEKTLEMSVADFKKIISKTIFSVATEEGRPMLKGCCLHVKEDNLLTVVALDGHRMSVINTSNFTPVKDKFKIILPTRSLNEILKILINDEEKVRLIISESKFMINIENTTIISQLIKGDFVNYDNIIPKDLPIKVKVKKDKWKEALSRILLVSKTDKNNVVNLLISAEDFEMSARGDNISEIKERVECKASVSDNIDIAFNGKFIMDILNAIDEDEVALYIKNVNSACIIRPEGNNGYLSLILPLRIK